MKKLYGKMICAVLIAALASGCASKNNIENGQMSDTEASESSSSSSSSSSSLSSFSSSSSSESSSSTQTSTSSVSSGSAPEVGTLGENFKLSDYVSGFDDVVPVKYTVTEVEDSTCEQSVIDKAIEAYESSPYFQSALDKANDNLFVDNGEIVMRPDSRFDDYTVSEYKKNLCINSAGELDIVTTGFYSFTAKMDGQNEESVVVLKTLVPDEFFEYSGTADFYPVVYINNSSEANMIDILSRQTLQEVCMIEFADGTKQLMVISGHTTGTHRTFIFSFKDGIATEEVMSSYIWMDGASFFGGSNVKTPFFWDGEKYCGISGVKPSKALADIICNDKNVLELVPDAAQEFEDGNVFIIGGKYVSFETQNVTYGNNMFGHITFEVVDGKIVRSDLFLHKSDGNELGRLSRSEDYYGWDYFEPPVYNINLDV